MKNLPTRKVLAFSLLSFMVTTQAADHYDPATQNLTIPQVVINNTTFTNVVVKLKDIEVLKIDPNPLVGVVDGGFLMQLVSAVQQGSQVKVVVKVTSQFKDRTADIGFSSYDRMKARLTDDQGNTYEPKSVQVGNKTGESYLNGYPFAADITTTITLTYNNIATNAIGIGLLDFLIDISNESTKPSYKVRNIPFQKSSPTSPF